MIAEGLHLYCEVEGCRESLRLAGLSRAECVHDGRLAGWTIRADDCRCPAHKATRVPRAADHPWRRDATSEASSGLRLRVSSSGLRADPPAEE